MATASRFRLDDELFETAPSELRSLEQVVAAWPDKDYEAIAKELGAPRDKVSYAIHAAHKREGHKLIEAYELTGTYGAGEAYDPLQDKAAMQRITMNMLAEGAASITGPAGKKS